MNNIDEAEKSVKRFLKKSKKLSYSVGLLIAFLINGNLAYSEEIKVEQEIVETVPTREQLGTDVKSEKERVQNLINLTEDGIKHIDMNILQLLEQGKQVIKPWERSWQLGVNWYRTRSKNKNRDINKYYPYKGIFIRSSDILQRDISPLSANYASIIKTTEKNISTTQMKYGLPTVTEFYEPIRTIVRYASIVPKTVDNVEVKVPKIEITKPVMPEFVINTPEIAEVKLPKIEPKDRVVNIVSPKAAPFTDFYFNGNKISGGQWAIYDNHNSRHHPGRAVIYSGMVRDAWKDGLDENGDIPKEKRAAVNGGIYYFKDIKGRVEDIPKNKRPITIIYRYTGSHAVIDGLEYNDGKGNDKLELHIRGYFGKDKDGYEDIGSGHDGGETYAGPQRPTLGTTTFHTAGYVTIKDMDVNLYGHAAFATSEGWQAGIVEGEKSTVNMYGTENTVFYAMPSIVLLYLNYGAERPGAFKGDTKVNMYGKNNNVYLTVGFQPPKEFKSDGEITMDGASNIVLTSYSYSPDWGKTLFGKGKPSENYHSYIKVNDAKLYGDETKVLFFGDKMPGPIPKLFIEGSGYNNYAEADLNSYQKGPYIGIYQGEIDVKATIGDKLSSGDTSEQTKLGQLHDEDTRKEYTPKTVDGAVGILAISGQRPGIIPSEHLGLPIKGYAAIPGGQGKGEKLKSFDDDKIHNLEVGKIDIRFGKYAKDAIMIAAQKGTAVDVGYSSNKYFITNSSSEFTDGINGKTTADKDAATGTIITYAEGIWKQEDHELGAKPVSPGSDTPITPEGLDELEGKSSEINIHIPLTVTSKEGIAFMGDNKGIVNAISTKNSDNNSFDTVATQYSSIIGYARKGGKVNIKGNIKATDDMVTEAGKKYNNIGGYANSMESTEDTVVNIDGKAVINGVGALAVGDKAVVNLNSPNNEIVNGENGGLIATNGGTVNFGGGKLIHGKVQGEHTTTPFYAENGGKINFTGHTVIEMERGILMSALKGDYSAGAGSQLYNGMSNIDLKFTGNDVILEILKEKSITWTGNENLLANVKDEMKVNSINPDGHDYKTYLLDGTFNFAKSMNLSDPADVGDFKHLVLSNEKIVIPNGMTISSTDGTGLAIASHEDVTTNENNGYENSGEINILAGTSNMGTALSVNFGNINNKNLIQVDRGIGAYGINGSTITNDANGKINITESGQGIVAFASARSKANLEASKKFGTDKKLSAGQSLARNDPNEKVFTVVNKGEITINGDGSVGIYANNNETLGYTQLNREDAEITNSGKINVNSNNSYGIVVEGKGANINLAGSGSEDIVLNGSGDIGVFAKNSDIVLNTDYGIKLNNNGVGIYLDKDSKVVGNKTLEIKYAGENNGQGIGIYIDGGNNQNFVTDLNIKSSDTNGNTRFIGTYVDNKLGSSNITNNGKIELQRGYGIISNEGNVTNTGKIEIANPLTGNYSIGIYAANGSVNHSGDIKAGDRSVGIYGGEIASSGNITVGKGGVGIISDKNNLSLTGGKIKVGEKKATGVLVSGSNQNVTAGNGFNLEIGDNSFGFVDQGSGNTLNISAAPVNNLGNETIFIYSADKTGKVKNNTDIKSTGNNNYGIYSAGEVENRGNIDFSTGYGNVGIYVNENAQGTNYGKIAVGKAEELVIPGTDKTITYYGIGMAAGFTNDKNPARDQTGTIINNGEIKVSGKGGIGMYGTGSGTTVENRKDIVLSADGTTGIYIDHGANGINSGTIKTAGSGLKDIVGVVVKDGAVFTNTATGKIILDAQSATGIASKGDLLGKNPGIIKNYGDIIITGVDSTDIEEASAGDSPVKIAEYVKLQVKDNVINIEVGGKPVEPVVVTGEEKEYHDMDISTIGMYIDTKLTRYTKPIVGLSALKKVKKADLIIGAEASEDVNDKRIVVEGKKLTPYNATIQANPQIEKWRVYSGSLTWMADLTQTEDKGLLEKVVMVKVPYTKFAGDKNTYNFLEGMEQRYGVEAIGSREKTLFNKITAIGKNEKVLFDQAVDEMLGRQYINTAKRVMSSHNSFYREFDDLMNWQTNTKDTMKVKFFGEHNNVNSRKGKAVDFKRDVQGVFVLNNNETVRLGESSGMFLGMANEQFKFKDIDGSKEKAITGQIGYYKSNAYGYNNEFNWTWKAGLEGSYRKMDRRYLVVDDIFKAKSKYHSYGVFLDNTLGVNYRLSEHFTVEPYAGVDLAGGRISKIHENSGEMRLDVKSKDYISVLPNAGVEVKYDTPLETNKLVASVDANVSREFGNIDKVQMRARVNRTTADYYRLPREKREKIDVGVVGRLGIENESYGAAVKVGYSTVDKALNGGVELRVKF
ncbi:hypothetical protein IX317_002105 [Fusobacterium sp. DD29]|uniref:autotransporter-associated N-terminal domain-containing protein n=1 Tax=unclassified Fusobacterium TaxID=2648384 RepID=UPI001B8D5946|nr:MULTISPECIES: autotransporter-associated N-terminal domain-containing protein [unclassified Fusobacterium]MBR8701286.1 hypothetical protein [Fusobacterium sp. DD45]MBR8711041.1 hypothetical protein [Fusobacterium sp. DD28]MBR8750383.1 hypothetical protein [Fusobacterium sp. DD29]MBR8751628.1 hypothetical protein [Fusobacterium sp. DD26]MBR8762623.1 hypothetical protein [Fusobacterium sp. DD25]